MTEENLLIVNKEAALNRLGDDEELYNEVVEVYFEDTPTQLKLLQQALDNKIINEVSRISHSIKSASANIGADRMSAASLRAEKAAKSGSLDGVPELINSMKNEFEELAKHLNKLG